MTKRIIYSTDSGGVSIFVPAEDARLKILVSEAQYEDYAATYEAVEVPAVYNTVYTEPTDTEPGSVHQELVTPATTVQRMVSPAGTRKVADAVYRDETDDEFYTRAALVCVPVGTPYKIVDTADIPADRTFRAAWTVDEALLTDGIGADYGTDSINKVVGWNEDGTPVLQTVEETQ